MKIGQIDITDNQLFFVKYSHCRLISFPQEIDRSPTTKNYLLLILQHQLLISTNNPKNLI